MTIHAVDLKHVLARSTPIRISFMCGLLLTVDCGSHFQSGTQDAEVRRSPSHCFWPVFATHDWQLWVGSCHLREATLDPGCVKTQTSHQSFAAYKKAAEILSRL